MSHFVPDSTKLIRSRLWCWGTLVALSVAFVVCLCFASGDAVFVCYSLACGLILQPIVIVLAERDYGKNTFQLTTTHLIQNGCAIALADVDEFDWQGGPFPQTDQGGCWLACGDTTMQIRFDYLSAYAAFACIKQLRATVPSERQRNWPEFCNSIALRLFFDLHHPGRQLPALPEKDFAASDKPTGRQSGYHFLLSLGGLATALGIGYLLGEYGVPNALPWSVGIFAVARLFLRVRRALQPPAVPRKFAEAQQIWETGVAGYHWR